MKKYRVIFLSAGIFIASLIFTNVQAQQAAVHVVAEGETLSKIAKNYGTTIGDIMRFNGMNTQSKLIVGMEIKIPPAGVHVIGHAPAGGDTAAVVAPTAQIPYKSNSQNAGKVHVVVAGETLYRISKVNHITIADLKEWNNLTSDNIKIGQVLRLSSTPGAAQSTTGYVAPKTSERTVNTNYRNNYPPQNRTQKTSEKVANTSASDVVNTNTTKTTVPKTSNEKVVSSSETATLASSNGGAFASMFGQDLDNETLAAVSGKAKTFKSQSGWTDQKFYIMMNDVTPGDIVKVTYNGISIFAKVLWNLIDTKENSGLTFRVSDATASVLGATGDTFNIKVDYYK